MVNDGESEGGRRLRAHLSPSLNGGGYRVEDDCVVEGLRVLPAVSDLLPQGPPVVLVEVIQVLKGGGILGDQSALGQERQDVLGQALFLLELGDIAEELLSGDVAEGSADFARRVVDELVELALLALVVGDGVSGGRAVSAREPGRTKRSGRADARGLLDLLAGQVARRSGRDRGGDG